MCNYKSACIILCNATHTHTHTHEQDLLNIARTTLSSKLLTQHKDHFSQLAVDAILRLKSSGNLEAVQIIKKLGGGLIDSYLEEGVCVCVRTNLSPNLPIC